MKLVFRHGMDERLVSAKDSRKNNRYDFPVRGLIV